jgi:hypothetical protein
VVGASVKYSTAAVSAAEKMMPRVAGTVFCVPLVVAVIATALIAAITLCWVLNIGWFAIVYSSSLDLL